MAMYKLMLNNLIKIVLQMTYQINSCFKNEKHKKAHHMYDKYTVTNQYTEKIFMNRFMIKTCFVQLTVQKHLLPTIEVRKQKIQRYRMLKIYKSKIENIQ